MGESMVKCPSCGFNLEKKSKFDFEPIYQKYPRKTGKEAGISKCKRWIKTKDEYDKLNKAVENFARLCLNKEKQFIPYFSSWMGTKNAQSWKDFIEIESEQEQDWTDLL